MSNNSYHYPLGLLCHWQQST